MGTDAIAFRWITNGYCCMNASYRGDGNISGSTVTEMSKVLGMLYEIYCAHLGPHVPRGARRPGTGRGRCPSLANRDAGRDEPERLPEWGLAYSA